MHLASPKNVDETRYRENVDDNVGLFHLFSIFHSSIIIISIIISFFVTI